MDANKVEIDGHTYMLGRLDAFQQFHVARKIGPIMIKLNIGLTDLALMSKDKDHQEVLPLLLGPVTEVVAKMATEDVDFVLHTCMGVCGRVDPTIGRASPVMRGAQLMFQDISMATMLQLTVGVLRENLTDFFPILGGVSLSPESSGTPAQGT